MNEKEIKQLINEAEIISFDVFDTLLFRITSRPEDIFVLLGQKIGMSGFEEFRKKKQQEISEILHITESTSRSQYTRAKQLLQRKINALF